MASTTPIRYLLCGKFPTHQQACIAISKPEFEVVKVASSVSEAKSAITELLGDSSAPQISAIAMGGGFNPQEFDEVHSVAGASSVPWLRPFQTKPGYDGPPPKGPPTAEEVSSRLRKALDEHAETLRSGKGSGEFWYF